MLNRLIQGLKAELKMKNLAVWFILSFTGVLLVFVCVMNRSFDVSMLVEALGFALVFVLMMIGTRCYGRFVDGYYQSWIDRRNKKNR